MKLVVAFLWFTYPLVILYFSESREGAAVLHLGISVFGLLVLLAAAV